ncbi:MAG: SsrA-binding protein SmpB [Clostridia bacterium]|nr:SsrA-binding protein SmpB [Clostridia bacterium]MCD8309227.1 SsrA-binding protein SmpB [Clostridia bacterium]
MKKTIAVNRSAGFEYFIEEKFEAGIVLEGAEVKSLRKGNCSLKDSFCYLHGGEIFIKNMHIAVYDKAGAFNSKDSKRDRKLLLHKYETAKIAGKVNEKGMTLVPISLYFSGSLIKAEIALCRGKQVYDKRRTIAERDKERDMQREIKNYI